ncbi:MAG TPA: methyltransferase domain-containing protein [Anaerolineales bacterium]
MLRNRLLIPFLRFFFKLLYHQFAWTYDWVAAIVSLGQWKSWVLSALPYLHGPRILEIGHGPGHLQVALRQRGFQPFGLDESRWMSRLAYLRLSRSGFIPVLVNGYAQFMCFPNASFDQVVATFPSDYIYDSHTLAEIRRVLTPGGELLVLPLAWLTSPLLLHRLAARLFIVTGESPPPAARPRAVQHFADLIRHGGFQVLAEEIHFDASTVVLLRAFPQEISGN